MSKKKISEHDRIKKNTQSISSINRRLDQVEQGLGSGVKQPPGSACRSNYSFVFGPSPFELYDSVATTSAGTWIPFNGCDDFYENTTGQTKTVTITIRNTSPDAITIDIDGKRVTKIVAGKTKTIIVNIPAEKSLHADRNGEYLQ